MDPTTALSKEESEKRIGSMIDERWTLESMLGFSSIAATYKARHRNGVEVAVKIIHRAHCIYDNAVDRFLREAHLANRIDHPGVERVLDDGKTEDGCVFLVMELLEPGESLELRRVAAGGKLSVIDARPIVDGMLDALIATHSAGVVHRNLKPGNVLLVRTAKPNVVATDANRVVLTDFGRARLMDGDPASPLSIEGLVMGTPAYMAPEQARGKRNDVDERSDIWSASAIIFTLLTGRRVHEAATSQEKLTMAATKPAPSIASVAPGFHPELAAVIDRALAFDKADRWPSALEMRRAWWLATGRDESTLPAPKKIGEREPANKMPLGLGGPTDPSALLMPPRNKRGPDLLPPPVSSFTEHEPPMSVRTSERESRAEKRSRWLGIAIVIVIIIIVIGAVVSLLSD